MAVLVASRARSLRNADIGRHLKPFGAILALLGLLLTSSTWVHLATPTTTGGQSVGRLHLVWTDPLRPELHTSDTEDQRQTGLVVWYPAEAGTGTPAPYISDLDAIREGLIASGEVSPLEAAGLRWVRSRSMEGAPIDSALGRYPLLVLSPGNATNVEFYASLAEDLASHGYVVAGLNHPFQVAAMELEDGSVAVYDHSMDSGQSSVVAKIDERIADIQFVLERLRQEVDSGSFLGGRVDLARIGVLGHSNGGVTAAEMCRLSTQVAACLNIDGQAASGPFGTDTLPSPVGQPFMYLTKETDIHPELEATFERSGQGTFRVVVPAATHEQFADGSLFVPSLSPFDRTVDRVHDVMRGMARAFFDRVLSQSPDLPLERIDAATDVFMYGYPLGANRLP